MEAIVGWKGESYGGYHNCRKKITENFEVLKFDQKIKIQKSPLMKPWIPYIQKNFYETSGVFYRTWERCEFHKNVLWMMGNESYEDSGYNGSSIEVTFM